MADIKKIAQALVLLSFSDMKDVAKVLKEEYDIEAARKEEKKFTLNAGNLEDMRQQATLVQTRLKEEQERKQKPYAPRKIGKPCGFPKNMRRK